MNPEWHQQQQQRRQLEAFQLYPQAIQGFRPQSSFGPSLPSPGFQPDAFHPPLPPSFPQAPPAGFAEVAEPSPLVAQPTRFGDPPMRMMPSPTFMPADTSMPYRPGSTPPSAGPPRQTQGPSLQQSTQQHDRNVGGGPEISWARSKDERRSDDAVFRRRDAQGAGFTSDRRSNGAPTPAVLSPKLAAPSKSNLGDSHVAQPTGFGDPPMRMMPSPTFMPADTSMPYRPGSTPPSAGPPRQTQGPSLQQSTQQHGRNVRGGPEISGALSEDERRSDDAVFRRRDAQGTGFTSDRRSNGAPIPAVLSPKLAAPSKSNLGDSHVAQPTGFGDPPMRMMPSPTFMPADTSMPYRPGSTPPSAGPPRQTQGPSLQQSTKQHDRNVGGGPEIPWARSKDERRSDDAVFRIRDAQGAGFTSDRRSNGAPTPAVLPPKLAAPSKSNLGDSHVAQPTGFGDPPTRMMPSPTFMPADTSMPYRPGSTPPSAGPPRQTQGPSLQQSTQQHDRNVRGGSEISWALSEDERRSDDAVFRIRDAQGTGFTSDRRLNGAPIPAVLPPKLAAPSDSYLGDSHVAQPTGLGNPPMRTTSPTATPAKTSMPYRPGSTPPSGPSQQAQGGSPQQCTHQHNQSVGGGSKVSWAMSKVQKKIQQFEQKVQQFDFQEAGLQLYDTLLVVQQNIELANSIVQTGVSLSDQLASQ